VVVVVDQGTALAQLEELEVQVLAVMVLKMQQVAQQMVQQIPGAVAAEELITLLIKQAGQAGQALCWFVTQLKL
jgi:hypothetical protein